MATANQIIPYPDFAAAATATVERLKKNVDMQMWMVTRRVEEDWVVLRAKDSGYGVDDGQIFVWSDSFCSRMVKGEGPLIAPDAHGIEAYAEAPIGRQVEIGAYVGMPICDSDGELFGTLCAIDPERRDADLMAQEAYIMEEARMLATILQLTRKAADLEHSVRLVSSNTAREPETGLYRREDFAKLLQLEEWYNIQLADPTGFLLLRVLQDTVADPESQSLQSKLNTVREIVARFACESDFSGRWATDQIATVFRNRNFSDMIQVVTQVQDALHDAGIFTLAGYASRHGRQPITAVIADAEEQVATGEH